MKRTTLIIITIFLFAFLFSCDATSDPIDSLIESADGSETFSLDDSGTASDDPSTGSGNGNGEEEAGLITAAEWNDLDNWTFWKDILNTDTFSNKADYWNFHTTNRIAVVVTSNTNEPVPNQSIELRKNGTLVWESKTDNLGSAELFVGFRQQATVENLNEYTLEVNGTPTNTTIKSFNEGVNEITLSSFEEINDKVEISFVVDATGSMGDELEFLKKDLLNVIENVEEDAPNLDIYTSTVFYRDTDDDYLVKHSPFSSDIDTTIDFIKEQSANGGGDFPEAVHDALNTALNELQWSANAKTRIAFLILDAPPHNNTRVIGDLQDAIEAAAQKGIKIIPITASGIDKETEYLMRSFSILTNSTYVFITNDSGIGGNHLEATVGEYQVEKLNALLVRLISKYSE